MRCACLVWGGGGCCHIQSVNRRACYRIPLPLPLFFIATRTRFSGRAYRHRSTTAPPPVTAICDSRQGWWGEMNSAAFCQPRLPTSHTHTHTHTGAPLPTYRRWEGRRRAVAPKHRRRQTTLHTILLWRTCAMATGLMLVPISIISIIRHPHPPSLSPLSPELSATNIHTITSKTSHYHYHYHHTTRYPKPGRWMPGGPG